MVMSGIIELIEKINIFEKLYDIVRIVDPITKKEISYKGGQYTEFDVSCFDLWGKGKFCVNCISIQAYHENKSFIKIEYTHNKIYIVMAVPVKIDGNIIIIELLKDATESLLFQNSAGGSQSESCSMIDMVNNLVLKDALTDLYNWRFINENLPVEILKACQKDSYLSVIISDIDFFKKVNDTYGHLTGNSVLKSFSNKLKGCVRSETDWIARYGGEEFLICLPSCDLEIAIKIAEEMRRRTEKEPIILEDYTINITASFGVCSMKPDNNTTIEDIIEAADKNLYIAKNNGRNKVEASLL